MSRSPDVLTDTPNELNLSRYLNVLRRYWRLIVAAGIVGAVLGFVYSSLQPVSYRAEAQLAIVRTGLLINLDARARTVSDTDPNAQSVDQLARRRSLTAIGESQDTALEVLRVLGAPPSGMDTPERLRRRVDVSLDNDVIRIQVTMPTAEQAEQIANTYASVYGRRVNALLGESALSAEALRAQTDQARAAYQTKQEAVSAYLAQSSIELLKRQNDDLARKLDARMRLQIKLTQLEQDALALQSRLRNNADTPIPGAQLAQILLEANAFTNDAGAASTLPRIDLSGGNIETVTAAEQAQTLEGLIAAIQARQRAQSDSELQALYANLNATQAKLEQAQAKQRELQADRDLAWNSYQLLATKMEESNITSNYQNEIVRVISPAVVPSAPVASRQMLNTLIGAALGVIVGAALVFVFEWLALGKKRAAQTETSTPADPVAR